MDVAAVADFSEQFSGRNEVAEQIMAVAVHLNPVVEQIMVVAVHRNQVAERTVIAAVPHAGHHVRHNPLVDAISVAAAVVTSSSSISGTRVRRTSVAHPWSIS